DLARLLGDALASGLVRGQPGEIDRVAVHHRLAHARPGIVTLDGHCHISVVTGIGRGEPKSRSWSARMPDAPRARSTAGNDADHPTRAAAKSSSAGAWLNLPACRPLAGCGNSLAT